MIRQLGVLLLLMFGSVSFTGASAATIAGPAEIIDGDTITIFGTSVRLDGIDAPEARQTCEHAGGSSYGCGKQARTVLAGLIGKQEARCEINGTDAYGRALGLCTAGDTDLNAEMVKQGWALAFVRYSDRFSQQEREAEAAQRGLWSGTFDAPWDWRAGVSAEFESDDCVIKGNISRSGEKIYHLPFQAFYDRTRITERKGERWFCTEDEARAAGWRRAIR